MRYSKAVQLVHEFSGALLCIDVQERAASEGFAMKVVLKAVERPLGKANIVLLYYTARCHARHYLLFVSMVSTGGKLQMDPLTPPQKKSTSTTKKKKVDNRHSFTVMT